MFLRFVFGRLSFLFLPFLISAQVVRAVPQIPGPWAPFPEPPGLGGLGSRPLRDANLTAPEPGGVDWPAPVSLDVNHWSENDYFAYTLTWEIPASPSVLRRFLIQRRDGPGVWGTINEQGPAAREYTGRYPLANETYRFRVIAVYETGPDAEDEKIVISEIALDRPSLEFAMRWRYRENKPYTVCGFEPFLPVPVPIPRDPDALGTRYRTKKTNHVNSDLRSLTRKHTWEDGTLDQKDTEDGGRDERQETTETYPRAIMLDMEGPCRFDCGGTWTDAYHYKLIIERESPDVYWIDSDEAHDIFSSRKKDCTWQPWSGTATVDGGKPATIRTDYFPPLMQPRAPVKETVTYSKKTITSEYVKNYVNELVPDSEYEWFWIYNGIESTETETIISLLDPTPFNSARTFSDAEMEPWCEANWPETLPATPPLCISHSIGGDECPVIIRDLSQAFRLRGDQPCLSDKVSPEVNIREYETYFLFTKATSALDVRWAVEYIPDSKDDGSLVDDPEKLYYVWEVPRQTSAPVKSDIIVPMAEKVKLGTYHVRPFVANLQVADWRGMASRTELNHPQFNDRASEYFEDGAGNNIPDAAGPTILVTADNLGLQPATLSFDVASIPDAAGVPITPDWELTLEWESGDFRIYRDEAEGADTLLSSPYKFKLSDKMPLRVIAGRDPVSVSGIRAYTGNIKLSIWDENGVYVGEDDAFISVYRCDLPEPSPTLGHGRATFSELTGSRYRKIGLNGRPLSDEKPQAAPESDDKPEESYIDALNLNLVHSTSDIHIPVPGSELALSVRRNAASEIWSLQSGFRPHERLDLPFGPAWTTNLASYIEFSDPVGTANDEFQSPPQATVHDDTGAVHRFLKHGNNWVPFAAASHEGRAYLTSLALEGDRWVFSQKYGKKHYFITGSTSVGTRGDVTYSVMPSDRAYGSSGGHIYSFARLDRVADRLGYGLRYTYPGTQPNTLIPKKIHATLPNGTALEGLQLFIAQTGNQRVTKIWSPMGGSVSYVYATLPQTLPLPADGQPQPLVVLTQVDTGGPTGPVVARTSYSYDTEAEAPTILEPPSIRPTLPTLHLNVASISDGNGNRWRFLYALDLTTTVYVVNDYGARYYPQTGRPRWVRSIQPPSGRSVFFRNMSFVSVKFVPGETDQTNVSRKTQVTDSVGATTTYTFSGSRAVTLLAFRDLLFGRRSPQDKFFDPRVLYHTAMTIRHGDLGVEHFTFLPAAGMALQSATDFSGNKTEFTYTSPLPPPPWLAAIYSQAGVSLFSFYDDVVTQKNAKNQSRSFTYEPDTRQMASIIDEAGRQTVYGFDPLKRRISETVYPSAGSGTPVKQAEFAYENAAHPGFMTRRTVVAFDASERLQRPWVTNLVTDYAPDALGQVSTETIHPIVDANDGSPTSLANLVTTYTHDLNGNRRAVVDPRGKIAVFDYDDFNRLIKTTWHNDDYVLRKYDLAGNLLYEKTVGGSGPITGTVRHEKYRYDAFRRRTHVEIARDAASGTNWLTTEHRYSPVGSLLQVTDPAGGVTIHGYDGLQRLQSTTDAEGNVTRFSYNDTGANPGSGAFSSSGFKPTTVVDARGFVSKFVYDPLYRLVNQSAEWEPSRSALTTYTYDDVGNRTDVVDPLGVRTKTVYDSMDRPIEVTTAFGTPEAITTSANYTATGLPWRSTDGRGASTETHYDRAGRAIKVVSPPAFSGAPQGIVRTFYDLSGNISRTVDPRGHATDFTYDDRNRLLSTVLPSVIDAAAITSANPVGTSARPATTTNAYRADGLKLSVTDPLGHVSATDAIGQPTSVSSDPANHHTTAYTYDGAGRLLSVRYPHSSMPGGEYDFGSTITEYDPNGNPVRFIDPLGNETLNVYDRLNRILSTTQDNDIEADGAITVSYGYDASGNRTSVADGRGYVTAFRYDGLNRLTHETDPLGATRISIYDALNKTRQIDFLGRPTDYLYDSHNRLTEVQPAGAPAENLRYSYDNNGNLLSAIYPNQDGSTNVSYTYDALNQRRTETSVGVTHTYGYDLSGNRISLSTDDAMDLLVTYEYDAANRLGRVVQGGGSELATTYGYDRSGNTRRLVLPNGETTLTFHDALNRMVRRYTFAPGVAPSPETGQPSNFKTAFVHTLDELGNVLGIAETYADGRLSNRTVTNAYDDIFRLRAETIVTSGPSGDTVTTEYIYDDSNNRKRQSRYSSSGYVQKDYVYNELNQLTSEFRYADGWTNVSYRYNANGNRTKRTVKVGSSAPVVTAYAYDRFDRLIQVIEGAEEKLVDVIPASHPERAITARYYVGGAPHSYRYDHRSRRVSPQDADATAPTRVTFAGGVSVAEYLGVSSTTPDVRFVRGPDIGGGVGGMLYSLRDGQPSYKHYNGRGDVVAATSSAATPTWSASYEAFGKRTAESGATADRQKANTKEEDPTGLLNEGFRYRDLETGAFLTRDPLGFVDGPNMYTYVVQNPWSKFDPEGLQTAPTRGMPAASRPPPDPIATYMQASANLRAIRQQQNPNVRAWKAAEREYIRSARALGIDPFNPSPRGGGGPNAEIRSADSPPRPVFYTPDSQLRITNPDGRNGSPAHQADVAANNNGANPPLQPQQVGSRVPDGVGQPGQAVTTRGTTITPGSPSARVIVESEATLQNGQVNSAGRGQVRDFRSADPAATIVVTDPHKPAAPPIVYPPGTQPPPSGRLPREAPTHVPAPTPEPPPQPPQPSP